MMKKRLQVTLAILSIIPLLVATMGITQGTSRWLSADVITPDFDSHYRYITGYYFSLGLLGLWLIPKIEEQTNLFRIVCASVFAGGVGRVISIVQVGVPSPLMLAFTALELCFPLLLFWQAKLSRTQHN
jgi:hypothetical protein